MVLTGAELWHDRRMGTFKLESSPRILFSQILNKAAQHGRSIFTWNFRSPRLMAAAQPRTPSKFEIRRQDAQLLSEFRGRLRQTEDLIGKLGYGLRELL